MAAKAGTRRRTTTPKTDDAGSGGDGRQLRTNDNLREIEEAERAQLISIVSRLQAQGRKVSTAKAAYDAERGAMNELFRHAKAASNFQRQELQALLDDLNMEGGSKSLVEAEKRRRRFREWLGLPHGEAQMDFFAEGSPPEVQDEAAARADGYRAYHRGQPCEAPEHIHPRHVNAFTQGWHDAEAATALAMKMTAPRVASDPELEDEPEDEPDIHELRRRERAEDAALRESLERMGDGFEAEPDELSQQTGRQVIQAKRDGADEPEAEGV